MSVGVGATIPLPLGWTFDGGILPAAFFFFLQPIAGGRGTLEDKQV
jgi:hypothetical protein